MNKCLHLSQFNSYIYTGIQHVTLRFVRTKVHLEVKLLTSLNPELFILWLQAHSISRHISVTAWQQLTSAALWTVINHWHETYCCLFHILCQLKRLPNIFSWHAGKSCKDLRGNDDERKAWPKRKVQVPGNEKWGTCHWYLQPHLPLQVPICSSTGPSTDRCTL